MITRFAPSPTGPLHLGHAYSAMLTHDMAKAAKGTCLLRIEDLDRERSKPKWETLIAEDLAWLGLAWPDPPRRQSEHISDYTRALEHLSGLGLVYPCRCNRADIRAALSAPQEGALPATGPDGLIYPGTCRGRPLAERSPGDALRLDISKAAAMVETLSFTETGPCHPGTHTIDAKTLVFSVGDVVLARRATGAIAYHLAASTDDALQGVTHVIRGEDLFDATQIHVLLQRLMGWPTPVYHHHRLIRDEQGKRLAKRDDARAISLYRADGASPSDLRDMVNLPSAS
ncbi:MAG: tRNA glutamyl-Q(34) synthetase GluQRS [Pseudomonadota bacterium]